jgi:small subunit ribosomal protein S6
LSEKERQYEIVLMIDPGFAEADRDQLVAQTKARIEADGSILNEDNWGVREMAYEIDHKSSSDYRWMRFTASTSVLDDLDHNLKITDGIVRFRIFRVDPDAPVLPAPPETAVVMAPTGDDDERRGRRSRDRDRN